MQIDVDWKDLKKDYQYWRKVLYEITHDTITKDPFELSELNNIGCYHNVFGKDYYNGMKEEWHKDKRIPKEWMSKGNYPGIWTALFSPENTYSISSSFNIIRFYFKEEYFIFDWKNTDHMVLWKEWVRKNDDNEWKRMFNMRGESLAKRMSDFKLPNHKKFFEENKFGAFVGYSDYISPAIVLEECIESVEFLH